MPATQPAPYLPYEIAYTQSITRELVNQHKRAWREKDKQLVSAILFGPLAEGEYDENINLLEIVKGYPGQMGAPVHEFQSTRQFPMYGRLRLRVISPEDFKEAVAMNSPFIEEMRDQKQILFDQRQFAERLLK
jgi:hypothetical protein